MKNLLWIFSVLLLASISQGQSNRNFLNVGGAFVGSINEFEGGLARGIVNETSGGPDSITKKSITNVTFDDLTIKVSTDLEASFYNWVQESVERRASEKDGVITSCDLNGNVTSQLDFQRGLITEITFPALDASSREAGNITVKIAPENTKLSTNPNGKCQTLLNKSKRWVPSNFKLELDGLDATRVVRIESFTTKMRLASEGIGRPGGRTYTKAEFQNLRVTISNASLKTWLDCYDSFLIKGLRADANEKSGAIVLLDPTLKNEIGRIKLSNVGMVRMQSASNSGEAIGQTTFELYVERMEYTIK